MFVPAQFLLNGNGMLSLVAYRSLNTPWYIILSPVILFDCLLGLASALSIIPACYFLPPFRTLWKGAAGSVLFVLTFALEILLVLALDLHQHLSFTLLFLPLSLILLLGVCLSCRWESENDRYVRHIIVRDI